MFMLAYFAKKKRKKMYMYKYISKGSFFKGKLRFRRVHSIFLQSAALTGFLLLTTFFVVPSDFT